MTVQSDTHLRYRAKHLPEHNIRLIHSVITLFFVMFLLPAHAQSVTPLRGLVSPDSPAVLFQITNSGDKTRDYALSWLELTAQEDGSYVQASSEEAITRNASSYLHVSPASFSLLPGTTQNVTVRLSDMDSFPARERRSHLLIRATPVPHLLKKTQSLLAVDMASAVSIPVILRAGKARAKVQIRDVRLVRSSDGGLNAEVLLDRYGADSLNTAVKVVGKIDTRMPPDTLAQVDNVALYRERDRRRLLLPLGLASLPPGQVEVIVEGRGALRGKVLARRLFNVGPPPRPTN